jgi:NAD(P)H-dependent FMN reductase
MADAPSVNVLGFAGSLRKASFNRMLLNAAVGLAPDGMTIDTYELDLIPAYNGDVEAQGDPDAVAEFKDAIRRADAILVVTPEYNYGVPGMLKNAIDWASRPPGKAVLNGKPAAIMGATPGAGATLLSQAAWLPIIRTLGMRPWFEGRVGIPAAGKVFDADGRIADAALAARVRQFVEGFAAFAEANKRPSA